MKRFIGLLLALGVVWLLLPKRGQPSGGGHVTESSRRVLDAAWRAMPESKMTIAEMERYAVGLSDEELWGELGKSYDDWFTRNLKRRWFQQPRLTVMLAREVGRRNGEQGLFRMAKWLDEKPEPQEVLIRGVLKDPRRYLNERVRVASFGGWVSKNPHLAISRLIDTRDQQDGDFPIFYVGAPVYWEPPEFEAVEEVLRDGFGEMIRDDSALAKKLFKRGVRATGVNFMEVAEVFMRELPRDEGEELLVEARGWFDGVDGESNFLEFLRGELFGDDVVRYFEGIERHKSREARAALMVLARAKPDVVVELLKNERVGEESMLGAVSLSLESPDHYHLMDRWALGFFLERAEEYKFGPIAGREDEGRVDTERLREEVARMDMDAESRREIEVLLDAWDE